MLDKALGILPSIKELVSSYYSMDLWLRACAL